MSEELTDRKWYEQTWVIVLFLIFFFPVGLVLMWRFANWSMTVKVTVTIAIAVLFILLLFLIILAISAWVAFISFSSTEEDVQEVPDTEEVPNNKNNNNNDNQEPPLIDENDEVPEQDVNGFTTLDQMQIEFDDRDWYENFEEEKEEGIFVREYLLEGESADSWTEVVTLHFMQGLQEQPLEEFVHEMKNDAMQSGMGNDDIEVDIIEKSDDDLLYDFKMQDSMLAPGRHEVARVIKADDGVYILHYANEDVPMPEEKKDEWLDLLKKAEVKDE